MKYTTSQKAAIKFLADVGTDKRFSFYTLSDSVNKGNHTNIVKFEDCELVDSISTDGLEQVYINGKALAKGLPITIDFETTGFNPYSDNIKVIGCSNGKRHWYWAEDGINFLKDCRAQDGNKSFIKFLFAIIQHNYKIYAYNFQFEYAFIKQKFYTDVVFDDDPYIFAYSFFSKTAKLSELASEYLNRYPTSLEDMAGRAFTDAKPFNWEDDIVATGNLENAIAYCCEDCCETTLLMQEFERLYVYAPQDSFWRLYQIDKSATHTVARMSHRGIAIDSNELEQLKLDLEAYRGEIIEEIKDLIEDATGDRAFANPKSPKQLNELFFETLRLDPSELTPNASGYSIDARARQLLLHQHPVVKKYDDLAKIIDSQNKYANKMQNWVKGDGKIHTQFNTCFTTTGRLSSSNPNLQNIPNPDKYRSYGNKFIAKIGERIRGLFVPDDGKILIGCDYSSFELRILAYISQEPLLLETFQQGKSLHDVVTEQLFNITLDKSNSDHVAKRTVTKTINFGMAYGMTAHRLYQECKLRGLGWAFEQCQKIISNYWDSMPALKNCFIEMKHKAIDAGYSETLLGRRRYYKFSEYIINNHHSTNNFEKIANKNDSEYLRQACNHKIQGTNADAIRIAMSECEKISPNLELLLNIHDEIIFQCNENHADYFMPKIKETMESAIDLGNVPVEAEPKLGYNWAECK